MNKDCNVMATNARQFSVMLTLDIWTKFIYIWRILAIRKLS